nr:PREDICTED: lysozyme C-1-like [Anolis carolinensis]|eukprot:XP_016851269.1 PREDICTED: lysozyme C-1-like [Anolis carolinensis]
MMRSLWSLVLLACLLVTGQGEYLSRCEVAQQLQQLGMDGYAGYSLANWVCTAFHESSFNTQAMHYDSDGSIDFGIFQINSRYWCQYGNEKSSNACGIQCSGENWLPRTGLGQSPNGTPEIPGWHILPPVTVAPIGHG